MRTVQDLMTSDLVTCPPDAQIAEAARLMRDNDIGDVLVCSDGVLHGIVTDRDLVVRCLAQGAQATSPISAAVSQDIATVAPTATVDEAADLMRQRALRRLPVVDGNRPIGIVTLGDLAVARDRDSALGEISAAAPND